MKKQFTILLFLLFPLFTFGQLFESGKISPYTAHFLTLMEKAANDTASMPVLKRQYALSTIENENYIRAFIKIDEGADLSLLKEQGVRINTVLSNIITAQIPVHKLETVAQMESVKRLEIGTSARKKMDKARALGFVDEVHAGMGEIPKPFTGKDVVVGIIDGGFEFGHINFYTSDANALRVKRVWNQNATSGTKPTGFSYGVEYTDVASIAGAQTDDSSERHGTHVTGIAAGADKNNNNPYYGIATEADIVLVSYDVEDNTIENVSLVDGINYIYDYASSVNKPAVVNMSLGYHLGPHDGTSLFDQATDKLQGKGRLLVGAVGNEANDPLHISKTFISVTDTLKTFFGFNNSSEKSGYADIWGDVNKSFKGRVIVYDKNTQAMVYQSPEFNASLMKDVTYELESSTDGASGEIYVYMAKDSENKRPNVFIQLNMTNILPNHNIGIVITANEGTVHAWADNNYAYFTGNNVQGWTTGNGEYSAGEIGGTGKKIISVGAYVSSGTQHAITSYSSRGPTVDGRVKPDITAPGATIISSFSRSAKSGYSKINTVNGTEYYYGSMEGTSMAAPFVTGVLALWLQAKKNLTPDEVRSVLQQTAITDDDTGDIPLEGSNTWGYGKINAYEGLKECIRLRLEAITNSHDNPILVNYPNPTDGKFNLLFFYDDTDVKLSIYDISGRSVYSESIQKVNAIQEIERDLTNLPKGIYFFQVVGTQKTTDGKVILR